ncbi:MAG: hypothetical protein U0Y82_10670 [Thermoleophilia bacterium]
MNTFEVATVGHAADAMAGTASAATEVAISTLRVRVSSLNDMGGRTSVAGRGAAVLVAPDDP